GFLVSEMNAATNTSILQWNIGATNGTYVIPFGVSSTYIPFTFAKTAGSSNMQFSTRATAANTNLPWSSSVTSMQTDITIYADGSEESVIDRWWDITALAGSTSVTANLTFSYRGSENTTSLAPTGTFGAQHWNGTSWDVPVGSGTGVTGGVGTVAVTGANSFSPWVLSSSLAPLPVELLLFTASLNNNNVDLFWATASETNNDFFTIEKSADGQIFNSIAIINGAGSSTSTIDYFDIDRNPIVGISYYRLKQTDFDGRSSFSNIVPIEYNPNADPNISLFPNPSDAGATAYVQLNQMEGEEVLVVLRDITGRELFSKIIITGSNNEIVALDPEGKIAKGSYLITASSANKFYSKNLIVK
ncbi:MAG TPA: T9SS type A sorting domain-containing protein, partial [Bacteroidia bacterium]|nr:T9SS type A sorting domain-containing protein [Bacteroidia bacterium]